MKKCPVCLWAQPDCNAYADGVCTALMTTEFEGRDRCPFYKSRNQARLDRLRAREREEARNCH